MKVNFDAPDTPGKALSENSTTLISSDGTCAYTRPFRASGVCVPEEGDNLDISVLNEGDTTLKIKVTLAFDSETVRYDKVLTPEDLMYCAYVEGVPGKGLSCVCTIEIMPQNRGETGAYSVLVWQS